MPTFCVHEPQGLEKGVLSQTEDVSEPNVFALYLSQIRKHVNMRAAFNNFDNDGDGHIDVSELHTALEALGLPCGEAQTAAVLAKFDNDGNLTLEVEEFQKLGASPRARALLCSCNSKCSWNARRLTIADANVSRHLSRQSTHSALSPR